jgi:hypothetical protein
MADEREPDLARLEKSRDVVLSFLTKKKRLITLLFAATLIAETIFILLMMLFMDFHSRLQWFMFFGFMLVYAPLVLFSWHNSVKIDHLYFRLIDELKYGGGENDIDRSKL